MIHPKEKAEKIRKAPSNSGRFYKKMTREERDQHAHKAMEHEKAGRLSSSDEYAYLKHQEADGK